MAGWMRQNLQRFIFVSVLMVVLGGASTGYGSPMFFGHNQSSAPTDPFYANVVLLAHMDGANNGTSFVEQRGLTLTPSAGYVTSTARAKFGSASGYFPGNNANALMLPASSTLILNGDFTIEFWIYVTTSNPNYILIGSSYPTTNNQIQINQDETSQIGIYDGSSWASLGASVSANAWHHIAFSRVGSTLRIYYDGNKLGDLTGQSGTYNFSGGSIGTLGGYGGPQSFAGYMDDIRITKGVGRYTGTSLSLPTASYPNN